MKLEENKEINIIFKKLEEADFKRMLIFDRCYWDVNCLYKHHKHILTEGECKIFEQFLENK